VVPGRVRVAGRHYSFGGSGTSALVGGGTSRGRVQVGFGEEVLGGDWEGLIALRP